MSPKNIQASVVLRLVFMCFTGLVPVPGIEQKWPLIVLCFFFKSHPKFLSYPNRGQVLRINQADQARVCSVFQSRN